MTSNVQVKITADVTDLQVKAAIAKAEFSGITAEINKLARASAAGTIDAGGLARMQQLAGDALTAKTNMLSLNTALSTASGGILGMAASAEHSHGSIATLTRESRALFDELTSGRTRQTPGTLAIIAQRVLGMGPAALGATAGVLALVGGLGYLAYRAIDAKNALDQIQLGAQFAGNMNISREALEQFSNELAKAKGISSSDARDIVGAFAAMHDMSAAQVQALTAIIADFAQVTGEKATEAADKLTKAFSSKESAVEYARSLGGVSQAQIDIAQTADQSGDAQQIFAAKFDILNASLDRTRSALDKHNSSVTASIKNWFEYALALEGGLDGEQAQTMLIEQQTEARQKQLQVLEQVRSEMASAASNPEQTLKTGIQTAEKENPVEMQANEAAAAIGKMNAALEIAKQRGDDVSVAKLNAGLEKAQQELSNLQFGPVLERMREQMEQVAATWDGTQSGLLAKQIQIGQATLASVSGNAKVETAVKEEIARKEVQLRQDTSAEVVAAYREQVSEIGSVERQGALERLAAVIQVQQQEVNDVRLTNSARISAQRELNASIAALNKESAAQSQTIARQDATTDVAISRMKIEAEKSALDLTAAADQASVNAKLAALKNLTTQEEALNEQALQNELDSLKDQPVAADAVYNEIRQLKARLVLDLQKLDQEAAEASKKFTKEQASEWRGTVGEIENAESGLVSDVLNKRKSLAQSILQIGGDLVTKEIANDVKAITTRLLLQQSAQTSQKALEQGGYLYHLLFETQKTSATVAQQAAQTAAVTSGAAAQNSAVAGAAAAGKSEQGAMGVATVLSDAAQAFAGAYAATAAIPIIGPELAPAVAAEAYGAVAGMAAQASLDTGTNYVPQDMVAQIHEGEAVVPKEYNPAAGGEMLGGGGDFHLHLNMSAFDASGMERLVQSSAFRSHIASSMQKYVNRGGRGV